MDEETKKGSPSFDVGNMKFRPPEIIQLGEPKVQIDGKDVAVKWVDGIPPLLGYDVRTSAAFTTPAELRESCERFGLLARDEHTTTPGFSVERLGEVTPREKLFTPWERSRNRDFLRREFPKSYPWAQRFASSILWLEAILDGAGAPSTDQLSWNFLATSLKTGVAGFPHHLLPDPVEAKRGLFPAFTNPPPLGELIRRDDGGVDRNQTVFTEDPPLRAVLDAWQSSFELLRDCYKRWAWSFARMGLVEIGSDQGAVSMGTTPLGEQAADVIEAIFGPYAER